jgi:hypothetical protein
MRASALQIFSNVRAFFAPVDRTSGVPAAFDPASTATFNLDAPPAPWLSLGEVHAFRRSAVTAQTALLAGPKGAIASQVRHQLAARVDFDFFQWGKLQMAVAGGSGQNNVIAKSNGVPVAPLAVLGGSTSTKLNLSSADAAAFHAGDLIACDIHYAGQTGYVGSGISAAYVSPGQTSDRDYIRRVTFNVARVSSVSSGALNLEQPLPGGAPPSNSFVQKLVGFTDREGGSFFHEWSAIFFLAGESGGQVCFYYPRLQPAAPAVETAYSLTPRTSRSSAFAPSESSAGTLPAGPNGQQFSRRSSSGWNSVSNVNGVPHSSSQRRVGSAISSQTAAAFDYDGDGLALATLHASFVALPVTDATDNDQAVCYRTYIPAPTASLF